jgi:hypothetical protein
LEKINISMTLHLRFRYVVTGGNRQ